MRFLFLDDAYPEAVDFIYRQNPDVSLLPYREQKAWWLSQCFGTADFWERALIALGHECETHVHMPRLLNASGYVEPDFREYDWVISQNVGKWNAAWMRERGAKRVAAFCSYEADRENMLGYDRFCTSFPWLAEELQASGERAVYLPLAFDPIVRERVGTLRTWQHDITFIGGLGRIWSKSTATIAAVAEAYPDQFKWWGYKAGTLPDCLNRTYQGPAFGIEYYRILGESFVTLNRHSDFSRNCGNNMRQYEASGMGAMLLTDSTGELDWLHTYNSPEHLVQRLPAFLNIAQSVRLYDGDKTLDLIDTSHTYLHRARKFIDSLE